MGLLKGNSLTVLKTLANSFYGKYLKQTLLVSFVDHKQSQQSLTGICSKYFYALTVSSVIQQLCLYPIDRLRTLVLTDFSKLTDRKSTWNTKHMLDIVKIEGLGKIYKGFRFSLICSVPENLAIVACFAIMREQFDFSVYNSIFLGSLIANTLNYPLDTVLRRYQSDSLLKKRKNFYRSVSHLMREINRLEGFRGYFKGFGLASFTNTICTLMYMGLFKSMYMSNIVLH